MSLIDEIWRRCWEPSPEQKSWEWCCDNIQEIPYSPIPGGFDPENGHGLKLYMEAMENPVHRLVVALIAVQKYKSLGIEAFVTWSVPNSPGPTIIVLPKADEAKDEMKTRLRVLMDNTPAVKALIPTGTEKDKATNTGIIFNNGMPLWVVGSHPNNLQRRSIRRAIVDEGWLIPPGRIEQLKKRTTRFGYLGQLIVASQGGEPDSDLFDLWESTTQNTEAWKCRKCGRVQLWEWPSIKFDPIKDEKGGYDYKAIGPTVHMVCENEACRERYEDTDEERMRLTNPDNGACFIPLNPSAPEKNFGIRATALSSQSWADLVDEYLRAKVASWSGDYGPLKLFHMQRLASFFASAADEDFKLDVSGSGYKAADWKDWQDDPEQWQEGAISQSGGMLRIVEGPASEKGAAFQRLRFCAIDVQRDHFWCVVRSFTRDGMSRLLWAGKLVSWEEIDEIQERYEVHSSLVFVDSGDMPFADVYPQAAQRGWCCLRGDQRLTFGHKNPGKAGGQIQRYYSPVRWVNLNNRKKVRVHHFSALNCRDILARLMQMPDRWQLPDDLGEICPEYEEQINAQRRIKNKNGKWVWQTIGKRGEHLADCEVECIVGGLMTKIIGAEISTDEETGDE